MRTAPLPSAPTLARRGRPAVRALGLVAALALGLAACGSDEEAAGGAGVTPTSAAEAPAETTTTAAPAPHEGPIDVTARDFAFEGLPAEVAAGPHTVTFTNEGTELHEMFLFRNRDGLSLEELHALGPAGAPEAVDVMGLVYVEPGTSDSFEVDLPAGEYEVVCFIPTPTDDRPHYEHGMHAVIQAV